MAPSEARDDVGKASIESVDDVGATVRRVFAEVLEFDDLALDDDFYALGGDSLHAVRVTLELERRFGLRIPDEVVTEMTTLGEVAAWIARALAAEADGGVRRADPC